MTPAYILITVESLDKEALKIKLSLYLPYLRSYRERV